MADQMDALLFVVIVCIVIIKVLSNCTLHNISLPTPLYAYQLAYYPSTETVFLFGGHDIDETSVNNIYEWEKKGTFGIVSGVQTPNTFASWTDVVAVIDTTVYFVGAFETSYASTHLYGFNMETRDEWLTYQTPPHQHIHTCVTSNKNAVFVLGGWDGTMNYDHLQTWTVADNTWTVQQITLTGIIGIGIRSTACAMTHNDTLYAFGGIADESLDIIFKYSASEWSNVNNMPMRSFGASTVASNSYIYIIGGNVYDSLLLSHIRSDMIYIFDIMNEAIVATQYMRYPLMGAQGVIIGTDLYIFGGFVNASLTLDCVQICSTMLSSIQSTSPTSLPSTSLSSISTTFTSTMLPNLLSQSPTEYASITTQHSVHPISSLWTTLYDLYPTLYPTVRDRNVDTSNEILMIAVYIVLLCTCIIVCCCVFSICFHFRQKRKKTIAKNVVNLTTISNHAAMIARTKFNTNNIEKAIKPIGNAVVSDEVENYKSHESQSSFEVIGDDETQGYAVIDGDKGERIENIDIDEAHDIATVEGASKQSIQYQENADYVRRGTNVLDEGYTKQVNMIQITRY